MQSTAPDWLAALPCAAWLVALPLNKNGDELLPGAGKGQHLAGDAGPVLRVARVDDRAGARVELAAGEECGHSRVLLERPEGVGAVGEHGEVVGDLVVLEGLPGHQHVAGIVLDEQQLPLAAVRADFIAMRLAGLGSTDVKSLARQVAEASRGEAIA